MRNWELKAILFILAIGAIAVGIAAIQTNGFSGEAPPASSLISTTTLPPETQTITTTVSGAAVTTTLPAITQIITTTVSNLTVTETPPPVTVTEQPVTTTISPSATTQTVTVTSTVTHTDGLTLSTVGTFSGSGDETTSSFSINGNGLVLDWEFEPIDTEYAVFAIYVHRQGESVSSDPVVHVYGGSAHLSGSAYVYTDDGEYYLEIVAYYVNSWSITVKEFS